MSQPPTGPPHFTIPPQAPAPSNCVVPAAPSVADGTIPGVTVTMPALHEEELLGKGLDVKAINPGFPKPTITVG